MATIAMAVPSGTVWASVREECADESRLEKGSGRMAGCEELAAMPLDELLYYVLLGEGRRWKEQAADAGRLNL